MFRADDRFLYARQREMSAFLQGGEDVAQLIAENKRLTSLLAEAERAVEEAAHLQDVLEAERESHALQVHPLNNKCSDLYNHQFDTTYSILYILPLSASINSGRIWTLHNHTILLEDPLCPSVSATIDPTRPQILHN